MLKEPRWLEYLTDEEREAWRKVRERRDERRRQARQLSRQMFAFYSKAHRRGAGPCKTDAQRHSAGR